jgi:hypothetical protein
MSGDLDLEQRYRRVLRRLPGYYRDNWEQDMVAALLESSPTDDPEEDEYIIEFGKPKWPEVAGVAGLAAGCTWAVRALRAGTSPQRRPTTTRPAA